MIFTQVNILKLTLYCR